MIEFHVFPGGKKRVVTFSYDDGYASDERLIALFDKYGAKGTFHLNGNMTSNRDIQKTREIYKGHEVSCHTARHGWTSRMPYQSVVEETISNRRLLESIMQYPVVGMSYPCSYAACSDAVKQAMKMCGIVYARTTKSTPDFQLPQDFMEWQPTCHHKDAWELCDKFISNINSYWVGPLFYIWGHSSEFKTEEDWAKMENLLEKLTETDNIWFATNMEIYQYMTAQRSLIISMDETIIYNPTSIPVWVAKNKEEIVYVPAGERITC